VPGVFEGGFHIHALAVGSLEPQLHHLAVGNDVELPYIEIGYLVLRLADDQRDQRLVHPSGLGQQAVALGVQHLPHLVIGGGVDGF
jgi:hypothetical protein